MPTIDLRKPRQVNFLTIQKDYEKILERFFSNQTLLKLLYHNTPDSLEQPDIEDDETLTEISKENIRIIPRIKIPSRKNSFMVIYFDNFTPNQTNPKFMDNNIYIEILCPNEDSIMMMDNYMLRPHRIMHEVNEMLDKTKLNGIGVVNFIGADSINLGEYYGYRLSYTVINDV